MYAHCFVSVFNIILSDISPDCRLLYGSKLLLNWPLGLFALAVHVHTKAVHCSAFSSSLFFKLQQPGQGSSLATVIKWHWQMLKRWDDRAVNCDFKVTDTQVEKGAFIVNNLKSTFLSMDLCSAQICQSVKLTCWSLTTFFRVWRFSIELILHHLSKLCRSAFIF